MGEGRRLLDVLAIKLQELSRLGFKDRLAECRLCDHHFHHHRARLARLGPWPLAKPVGRAAATRQPCGAGRLDHAHPLGMGGTAGKDRAERTAPRGDRGAQPGLYCNHPHGG